MAVFIEIIGLEQKKYYIKIVLFDMRVAFLISPLPRVKKWLTTPYKRQI